MIQISPVETQGEASYFYAPKSLNYTETPGYQLFCETHIKLSGADSAQKTVKEKRDGQVNENPHEPAAFCRIGR